METRQKAAQGQLGLFLEQKVREEVRLPEAICTELIKTLAGLFLEAAGVARDRAEGGGDESEDHA
jgi:hypothetical protein